MNLEKRRQMLKSLEDEETRRSFVVADIGMTLAPLIFLLRKKHGWTQKELARRVGLRQTIISRMENPSDVYRYNLKTIEKLATVFDVALMVKFVSFSEIWMENLTAEWRAPLSFADEASVFL